MLLHTHVVGHPIAHSLSPAILAAAGVGIHCERADVDRGELAAFLAGPGKADRGLSVTMPLKKEAFSICTQVEDLAMRVGAINTIVIEEADTDGDAGAQDEQMIHGSQGAQRTHSYAHGAQAQSSQSGENVQGGANAESSQRGQQIEHSRPSAGRTIYGLNTDVAGIVQAIRETLGEEAAFTNAVILGSGATAGSALAALQDLGQPQTRICSRRRVMDNSVFAVAQRLGVSVEHAPLTDVHEHIEQADIVISTLPAHVADPLAQRLRGLRLPDLAVLDASYNPYPSDLTTAVLAAGGTDIPGYEMLIHQGIEQARIFSGREPDAEAIHAAVRAHIQQRSN